MGFGKLRILALISGGGSTMESVIQACRNDEIYGDVVHVISNKASAGGLAKAQRLGVPTSVLRLNADFAGNREAFGEAIIVIARRSGANFAAQLGWLALTPANVIRYFGEYIINQHPGPLDPGRLDFGGRGMHGRAVHSAVVHFARLINRRFLTEATVHRVTEEYDKGPLLGTKVVCMYGDDTAEELASRVLPVEHRLVVDTLRRFSYRREEIVQRICPLIWPGEEDLHRKAIEWVIQDFPNG